MPKARSHRFNIAEAKARLSELVERAAQGEEIILARHGKPKARLVPLTSKKTYVFGAGKAKWKKAERILHQSLPKDFLEAFDAGSLFPPKSGS